jgi:tetratricopeptide (TPR) repeat protein
MNGLKGLVNEAHRRSLWQILGIYLAACWIVLQVIEVLTNNMGLPDWVPPFAIVLLLIGLPVVLATAFVQEGVASRNGQAPAPQEVGGTVTEAATESTEATPAPARAAAPEPAAAAQGRHGLFTWRNALVGGAAAFVLLGVLTGGWMIMRTAGIGPAGTLVAKGVLDERDRIVLADFASGDSLLARAATEAFRVDLSQSQMVKLAERRFISDALGRMELDDDAPLDHETARELARREGIKAVLAGEITPAGGQFVLSAELQEPTSGEVLVAQRETAKDSADIVPSIDRLSKKVRERIGESLRTINAEAPLERVTTGNLESLRKYSQALRVSEIEGDSERALELFEEAVALDSGFAMGWRGLGIELANLGQERARYVDAFTRAYENRDRLTERERYLTMASYYSTVTNEDSRAINAYESVLDLNPNDGTALNNIAVLYSDQRDFGRAEEFYLRGIDAGDASSNPYTNVVIAQVAQGKYDEAATSMERFETAFPGHPAGRSWKAFLASSQGDYDGAREYFQLLLDGFGDNLILRANATGGLVASAAVEGRLAEAEQHLRELEAVQRDRGINSEALGSALWPAWFDLLVRRDYDRAVRRIDAALERYPLEELPALDRPYLQLVNQFSLAERPDRAREMLAAYEANTSEDQRRAYETDQMRAQANLAVAEDRFDEAIDNMRQSDEGACSLCPISGYASAFDAAGQADSTIAYYERYVATPWLFRLYFDSGNRAHSFERLGQLYDAKGDLENAAKYYAMFVELWAEADEELQPRVLAAQARLEEIVRQRG